MRNQLVRRSVILAIFAAVLIVAFPGVSQAEPLILRGYDLFATDVNATKVNLGPAGIQPFKGVPLQFFMFGTSMSAVQTFNTDTIVQRLGDASPANPTVALQMVALQLMSVNQFDLGGGNDFHFITLQSARGGPASTGLMTVTFGPEGSPHGTFDSTLDVFFDIRVGSLEGPILVSGMKTIIAMDVPWSHFAPGGVLIPGINFLLSGQDRLNDFFPIGLVMHANPDGSMHTVQLAEVPEPTTIGLLAVGIAGVAARVFKRRKERSRV